MTKDKPTKDPSLDFNSIPKEYMEGFPKWRIDVLSRFASSQNKRRYIWLEWMMLVMSILSGTGLVLLAISGQEEIKSMFICYGTYWFNSPVNTPHGRPPCAGSG